MRQDRFYIKVWWLAVIFLFGLVWNFQPQPATASGGLQAAPSLKEVTISPEQNQVDFPIHVRNNSQNEVTLLLSVVDFGALDESGGVAFLGEAGNLERKYGLAGWSSLDKDSITLLPGQSGEVKVSIINRPTLALGGHYGAVLFKLAAPPGTDPQKVKLNQVFSSLILAKKTGGESYNLSLDRLERVNSRYKLPDSVKLRFYNGGNVHVAPGGSVQLVDPLGREVASGNINPEAGRILPENFRLFPAPLKRTKTAWVPGHYRIIVKYNFDDRSYFATYESSFIFVNGLGIALLASLLLLLIYLLWKRPRLRLPARLRRPKDIRDTKQLAKVRLDTSRSAARRSILSILKLQAEVTAAEEVLNSAKKKTSKKKSTKKAANYKKLTKTAKTKTKKTSKKKKTDDSNSA